MEGRGPGWREGINSTIFEFDFYFKKAYSVHCHCLNIILLERALKMIASHSLTFFPNLFSFSRYRG